MDDEELKKILARKLSQIKIELDTSNTIFKELNTLTYNSIRVNKKCLMDEEFQNIKSINNKNTNSLINTISSARRKS